MAQLVNLVVDLARDFDSGRIAGVDIGAAAPADGQTLAWIDETFGGSWSSEAYAGDNIVARRHGAPVGFATIDAKGLRYAWLGALAREPGVGIFGPFGVAPQERGQGVGRALLQRALDALRARGYARALLAAAPQELVPYYAAAGARVAERFERSALCRSSRRVLVLASGNGTNFQAVVDASRSGELPVEIAGLLVNSASAYAIERARSAGIASIDVVPWDRLRELRTEYDERLLETAMSRKPDLVLLLGWMHLLSDAFVRAFPDLFNLHPAFLPLDPARDDVAVPDGTRIPAFRGARAIRDALAACSGWVGATLHRVTGATDRGPVVARKPLRVEAEEGEAHLMERVHAIERDVVRSGVMRWLYER